MNESLDPSAALTIAVPIGVLMGFVTMFVNNVFLTIFAPLMDKYAAEGNAKKLLYNLNFGVWFFKQLFFCIVVYIGVYLGYTAVSSIVDSIPAVVMTGLTVCGQLLPAVGLALLMKMIWTNANAPYYFLGFIAYMYFGLPVVAIAALGIIIIVLLGEKEIELNKVKQQVASGSTGKTEDEVEDFLQ